MLVLDFAGTDTWVTFKVSFWSFLCNLIDMSLVVVAGSYPFCLFSANHYSLDFRVYKLIGVLEDMSTCW
jgi:hypothetical protein